VKNNQNGKVVAAERKVITYHMFVVNQRLALETWDGAQCDFVFNKYYAILFSDERLRTYRCNYCFGRYRCSFATIRASCWALACNNAESNIDTIIVVCLIMNFL